MSEKVNAPTNLVKGNSFVYQDNDPCVLSTLMAMMVAICVSIRVQTERTAHNAVQHTTAHDSFPVTPFNLFAPFHLNDPLQSCRVVIQVRKRGRRERE